MKGFIINSDSIVVDGYSYVRIFGKLTNKDSFVVMNKFNPYFFVLEKDKDGIEKLTSSENISIEVVKSDMKNFENEKVLKIIFNNQLDLNKIDKLARESEILRFESDIKPEFRFIIDNDIKGFIEVNGDYESSERIDRVYKNSDIKAINPTKDLKLKIVSVDIESGSEGLFCIGIYSDNYKKNFFIGNSSNENSISCKNEEECLIKFRDEIIDLDPDIITGWNVIDFDFDYLKKLFDKYNISMDIGRTNDPARLKIESSFLRTSRMNVPGRVVLDGLSLIRDPFIQQAPSIKNIKFESFTLGEVANQIIGKTKLIKGKSRHNEIEELYNGDDKDKNKLIDYNLLDCELVYEILKKTNIIELAIERASLTGMMLNRISSSVMSFDSLYIREARKMSLVSPSNYFGNDESSISGGFVMNPIPGLYNNVIVLDFKSLYPSIIKTFNIDPSSYLKEYEDGAIESPNGAYFKNSDGILPKIIEVLHKARERAKIEKRELSSYAIKIIMNSFFGVLATPSCRYFNPKIGGAITSFGQEIIKMTAGEIEEMGYSVIYSDTDSVFVFVGEKENPEEIGKNISDKIDIFYEKFVKNKFSRKSYLDLEFEKVYVSLLMPKARVSKNEGRGAKKRYAGLKLVNGKKILDVVGLEAVRGDWTDVAREFQKELLTMIFDREDVAEFVRDKIKEVKSGKIDGKLIYRKSIRKNLDEYVKITPSHVKAARKLDSIDGNVIEYYMTVDGPEPIQKLVHSIDYAHYIEKQIKPIAKTIIESMDLDFDEIINEDKQKKLF